MSCTDKFGQPVPMPGGVESCDFSAEIALSSESRSTLKKHISGAFESGDSQRVFSMIRESLAAWSFDDFREACRRISELGRDPGYTSIAIEALTLLNDRRYPTGAKKRSSVLHCIRSELDRLLRSIPRIGDGGIPDSEYRLIDFEKRGELRSPSASETTLVVDAGRFPPEGDECDAALVLDAYIKGWKHFICFGYLGQRFAGCGLGPDTGDVTIDVYGSSGDYLGSGIDGLTIRVHNNAQDQVGQIIKAGKLVIYGDVGQTFMYGAKGGSVFVLGNAAGRPLINGVGRPKVVINGTCLDFLAESFMAGDPFKGGGFVILNGIEFDDDGNIIPQKAPYPGSNLFSLASGGAIYIRDPYKTIIERQLNGGSFMPLTVRDWDLIHPFLEENARLFGIPVVELLTVDGKRCNPDTVYRKVAPVRIEALASGASDVFVDDKTVEEIIME